MKYVNSTYLKTLCTTECLQVFLKNFEMTNFFVSLKVFSDKLTKSFFLTFKQTLSHNFIIFGIK